MSSARISTCLSAFRDIIICGGVLSENFLVSLYHLLILSSERIISSCLKQIKRKSASKAIYLGFSWEVPAKHKCTNTVAKQWNVVTTVTRSSCVLWSKQTRRNWPEEQSKADMGRNHDAARKPHTMAVLKSAWTAKRWDNGGERNVCRLVSGIGVQHFIKYCEMSWKNKTHNVFVKFNGKHCKISWGTLTNISRHKTQNIFT